MSLFRLLLRLYPQSFRDTYESSMLEDFARRREAVRAEKGSLASFWYLTAACLGVIPSALRVRTDGAHQGFTNVRQALRAVRRAPSFSVLTVGILLLGVGGGTLIFSVLYGVILDPLPYEDPDGTVIVWTFNERQGLRDGSSYHNIEDWDARSRGVEEWALFFRPQFTGHSFTTGEDPIWVEVGVVSSSFFSVLGVEPILGRTFTEDEERAGEPLIVIGEGLWREMFGASPDVLDQTALLDGETRRIVGVMPSSLEMPLASTEVWTSHAHFTGWPNHQSGRGMDGLVAMGRLAPGVTVDQARTELEAIASDLSDEYVENEFLGVEMASLLDELTGEEIPRTLWLLQVGALLVLLAVAANVAQLWLMRSLDRRADLAVRMALGSSRGRVFGNLMAEGALLSTVAAVLGVTVAWVALDPLLALLPIDLPRLSDVGLQPVVVAASVGASLALGLVAALLGAVLALRGAEGRLGSAHRSIPSRARGRLRAGFVVGQTGVATLLLVMAVLFAQSLQEISEVDTGLDTEGVLVAKVQLSWARDRDEIVAFHDDVLRQLKESPGILHAGAVSNYLYSRFPDAYITPEHRIGDEEVPQVPLMTDGVLTGGLYAMGVKLLSGRMFYEGEQGGEEGDIPVIINQAAAEAYWPGMDPLGRRFQFGVYDEEDRWREVVGVVANTQRGDLDDRPLAQIFGLGLGPRVNYVMKVEGDPLNALPSLRQAMANVDPTVPIVWSSPAEDLMNQGMTLWRLRTVMAVGAAGLVALLALVGMYGLLNEAVLRRKFEIGIRMALGAEPTQVRDQIVARGVRMTVVGVIAGVGILAFGLAQFAEAFLYGVSARDPMVLGMVAVVMLGGAALASWLPARRASRVDPARCLENA